jgi:hypothetical protein
MVEVPDWRVEICTAFSLLRFAIQILDQPKPVAMLIWGVIHLVHNLRDEVDA